MASNAAACDPQQAMELAFRILGPLEVEVGDGAVALGRREAALLGILLLNAGEVVSIERLIDGVWGDARPTSAKHMLHEYVSRLRLALGDASLIETRMAGYVVRCSEDDLDLHTFSRLVSTARGVRAAGDPERALDGYEQALRVWRGDVLAGVPLEGSAQTDAARLEQERQLVTEERFDCALALGHHRQLIPELERHLRNAPLRDRPRAQLMLALYRAGRQTEALDCYRDGRALLVDQAGVEPGRELRELERAILTQDPSLDLEAATGVPVRASSVRARPRWRRAALAVVPLLVVLGALVFLLERSGPAHALTRIDPDSAGAIDPGRNRLVDEVPVGAGPGRLVAGLDALWVVNALDDTVSRIDPESGAAQIIPVCASPTALAIGAGLVWVTCAGSRSVEVINPKDNRPVRHITVGTGPSAIAFSPGRAWVTNRLDDTVTEIDAKTGRPLNTFDAGPTPSDIAYGFGSLWITSESSASVTRLDPATHVSDQVPVGNGPEAITIAFGSAWVANTLDGTVSRIAPDRNVVTYQPTVGPGPSSIAAGSGSIWVADSYGNRVVRIDPARNEIVHTIPVGNAPQSLVAAGSRVWMSTRATTATHRGGTLRLFLPQVPDSLDSAAGYSTSAWSVLADSGDGLVGYKRVDGVDGGTLIPDLATALPKLGSALTYTFQLRRGIRYSNGQAVRASDLRRALERFFRLGPRGTGFYTGLVGADACSRARCDLSHGIVSDDAAGTVTLHLHAPDPELESELALPFAYPVPDDVPMTRRAPLGVPGTGPYTIASYHKARGRVRVILVRNPHFREWSAAAQPDGYPDRIEWTYGNDYDRQLTAVERGDADVMQSPLPPGRADELTTRYSAQLHLFPYSATFALFLNTRTAPFDNQLARQAVNLAMDRARAVSLIEGAEGPEGFGGVASAAVTCQIVPAGIAGYRPYCPYTARPTSTGAWNGPDLERARRLVAASGTSGQKVTYWTGPLPIQRAVSTLAVATLRALGYRVTVRRFANHDTYWTKVWDSRTRAQAGFYAFSQDYPNASNFLGSFTCRAFRRATQENGNISEICDPSVDRAVERARSLGADSAASSPAWAAADRRVTDAAAWVPLVNTREVAVVSRRAHNVEANPQWGILADQIWVR